MNIKSIFNKIIFPEKNQLKRIALEEERLPIEELKRIQWINLKKLLNHAYKNVPFYRMKFEKAGITPDDIKKPADMKKIPVTTKEELKENFPDSVIARNLPKNRFFLNRTSGSSGAPFEFYIGGAQNNEERKALFRIQAAMGIEFGGTIIRIRNHNVKGHGLKIQLQKLFGNTKHLSTKGLKLSDLPNYIKFIRKHKPSVLESFPHHILALAAYMKEKCITLNVRNIHIVGGNASKSEKKLLSELFNAQIFNDYGASECMYIAYQCEQRNQYHLEITRYFIEILNKGKDAKENEMGEIVLTNLFNYAMPFIRYRIKDLAIVGGTCNCRRTFPVIRGIEGRVQQVIFLPNGRLLDQNLIRNQFSRRASKVKAFQCIYRKENVFEIKVVPAGGYTNETENELIAGIKKVLHNGIPVKIVKVDSIPLYGAEQKEMSILTEAPPDLTKVE